MSSLTRWLDKTLYRDYGDNWDDQMFRERILSYLEEQRAKSKEQRAKSKEQRAKSKEQRAKSKEQRAKKKNVLDLGAGAGIIEQMNFKELAGRVCGVDPDPRVIDNPYLDEGKEGMGEQIPYPDESFDLVFSVNVLEHLDQPEKVFAEINRTLKPGGVFLGKTPNKWHYMPLISSLTPHGFHQWFNKKRGRESVDTFPTRYRANSRGDIRRLAKATGFEVLAVDLIEGRPEYMRLAAPLYIVGWLYEKAVNYIPGLGWFRILLISELRKPKK